MTGRQRRIGIANEVRRRTGEVYTFALSWDDGAGLIARIQRGPRRFEYKRFVMDTNDERTIEAIAAWVEGVDNVDGIG